MGIALHRRNFLKSGMALSAGWTWGGFFRPVLAAQTKGAPSAAKLGWQLGCAAYSFNPFTFVETIEKVKALGLDFVEGFTWQRLSPEKRNIQTGPGMSAEDRKELAKRLADSGVKLVSCYCSALDREEVCRATFEFAKDLGIQTLVGEPPFEAYDMLERFCDRYQINLAVHNHPAPSRYWNPDTLLAQVKSRSRRIGACADTGHWVRSGLDPVEMLKKLEGHIVSLHLKDVDLDRKGLPCVPWGTGKGNVAGILRELHRQRFQGLIAIEYEPYSEESFDKIAQCIAFFEKQAAELAG